jgi:glycerol-3-phosphate dehydrogenase
MQTRNKEYDLLVVGGGINGVGIALDAAGRNLNVALCEKNDLGASTSSNSSKLIHGGLRYLEYYEFRLVKEALEEREVLLRKAPHIIWPLRFRLPHRSYLRPAWMVRAGLFIYDHLSKRKILKGSRSIKFGANSPIVDTIKKGFEYSDEWVDDARLVVLNAMAAGEKGAKIMTRTCCTSAQRKNGLWEAVLEDSLAGEKQTIIAKVIVNASGPWVTDFFETVLASPAPKKSRLIAGSHIIVARLHNEPQAYILQNEDKRIVFVIPYEDEFSLVGTTDIEYRGDPANVTISNEEKNYLLTVVNTHFKKKITLDDVVSSYSGVRPLMDDEANNPEAVTRDYSFEIDQSPDTAPLISIFGGKITTYRKLSEEVVNEVNKCLKHKASAWTKDSILPGGDFSNHEELNLRLSSDFPWCADSLIARFVKSYGTLSYKILFNCKSISDLGINFGAGLYQKEVEYLMEYEWAISLEDIIHRRTRLHLKLTKEQKLTLSKFIESKQLPNNTYL